MLLIAGGVLDDAALAWALAEIEALDWRPGHETAGPAAREVKRNEQADLTSARGQALEAFVRKRILSHPIVALAARPRRLSRLLLSRTDVGGGYGPHVDNALMGGEDARLRSDLSFTLFLTPPDAYDGGALRIHAPLQDTEIRLPPGDLILYPSGAVHEVTTVERGRRLAFVGWIESQVRDPSAREVLWDLEQARAAWPAAHDPAGRMALDKAIGALLRRWAAS
ncbi:Fe2+-dependent dioxygenase [Brevundimonas balnearis]|uniref:Fe2+-dependent dioxygenase n=1 Tax=Brevundimonas balnearis TaxID=1572858 RepID=A0ABV6R0U9_9CAUL